MSKGPHPDQLARAVRKAARIADPAKRRLYVVGLLTRLLEPAGTLPVVVGGAAVEFYTLGAYATLDVDLVIPDRQALAQALQVLGFQRRLGERHWYHEELDLAIEAPDERLAGSLAKVVQVQVDDVRVHVIGIEDLILDRLRAFVHWRSTADGEWAARLWEVHRQRIDTAYLEAEARQEGLEAALDRIRRGQLEPP